MPDSAERIRDMVRAALQEDPRVKNQVLMDRARQIDEGAMEELTPRQFHGKFRLPVARSLASASAPKAKPKRAPRSRRTPDAPAVPAVPAAAQQDAVRDIFRRFAVQLSKAEGRSEIVRAAARIDEFVEEVFRTLGSPDRPEPEPTPGRRRRRAKSSPTQERARPEGAEPAAAPASPRPTASVGAEETALPARDMRRRRRPKSMLKSQPEPVAEPDEENSAEPAAAHDDERGGPQPAAEPGSSSRGLLHDLEEFRRRRAEREMRGRLAP